jgi:cytochrome c556
MDPAQLEAAAATLDAEAAAVPVLLDAAIDHAGLNVWEGSAQADLWSRLHDWRHQLESAGQELRSLAGQLRGQAADIRAELAREEARELARMQAAAAASRRVA